MNLEDVVLNFFSGLSSIDFNSIALLAIGALVLFWLFVVAWVWFDSGERLEKGYMRVISALLVLIFGVPGLLIYLMMRPKMTLPEQYWSELERRYLLYETAELNDCENCGEMLQPGFVFCPNCKYEVKVKCSQCGVFIDKRWRNCPHCGDNNTAYIETTEEKNDAKKKIRYESFGEFLSRKVNETKTKYDQKKLEKEATIVDAGRKVKEVKVKTLEKDSSKVKNNKGKKQKKNKNKSKR